MQKQYTDTFIRQTPAIFLKSSQTGWERKYVARLCCVECFRCYYEYYCIFPYHLHCFLDFHFLNIFVFIRLHSSKTYGKHLYITVTIILTISIIRKIFLTKRMILLIHFVSFFYLFLLFFCFSFQKHLKTTKTRTQCT